MSELFGAHLNASLCVFMNLRVLVIIIYLVLSIFRWSERLESAKNVLLYRRDNIIDRQNIIQLLNKHYNVICVHEIDVGHKKQKYK